MEWQPIETAPKNTHVIIGCSGSASQEARWLHARVVGDGNEGWYSSDSDVTGYNSWRVNPPTHWMPLPPPPEAK